MTTAHGNYVLILLDRTREEMDGEIKHTDSGLTIPTSWQRGRYSPTTGTVISVGEIYFQEDITGCNPQNHLTVRTENELRAGDNVIFDYREIEVAKQYCRYYTEENKVYVFISYSRIFIRIRDKEVRALNGYLIIEPLMEKKGFLEYQQEVPSETKGIIRYAGSPVIYRDSDHDEYAPVINVNNLSSEMELKVSDVGDMVLFKDYNGIPLQHEFATLNKVYVRMQRESVDAILV